MRKDILSTGEVYHICTKSIAGYKIFNDNADFERMRKLIKYYQIKNSVKFSDFVNLKLVQQEGFHNAFDTIKRDKDGLVQIIAYCLMPTHIHLILKQLVEDGISCYMKDILNSYTKYFNNQHKRKGPLWEGRFKNVLVVNDEQLLHLTRYLHLNPVTAKLVNKPQEWDFSSYNEYLKVLNNNSTICQFNNLLEIQPSIYRKFVNDQISYQRELSKIKKLFLD